MNIRPLHDRVVVKRLENEAVSTGGIVLPGSAQEKPMMGEVVAAGTGRVLENGMPRFFRRFAEGQFDEDDVRVRAAELASFVHDASKSYGFSKPVALGFSNGANIAAALLTLYPDLLAGAVLLRAMVPFKSMPPSALTGVPVLLVSGAQDAMIPKPDSDRLASWLRENGAILTHNNLPTGHGLTHTDVSHMTQFLAQQE